jgi:hypothetical protein
MGSPSRLHRTFVDADGIRWDVEARLLSQGADAIPIGFAFTSRRGEHRALDGSAPESLSWEHFCDRDWCELLVASRLVRPATPRVAGPRVLVARPYSRW